MAFGFADDPDWNMMRGPDEMKVWVTEDGKRVGVQIGEQKRALSPEDAREMATDLRGTPVKTQSKQPMSSIRRPC